MTMAFTPMTPSLGYPAIGAVVTSGGYIDEPPLGTIITAVDPDYGAGEFIYLAGVASTARGSVVVYNAADYSTTLAQANAIGPIALAMGATVASTKGWYQIGGKGVARVLSGFADNANCYLTSTAGSVDDTVVAGDYVFGMKGASAIGTPATGLAEVELQRPFVKDGLDDATS
jgi:hypothetical protein